MNPILNILIFILSPFLGFIISIFNEKRTAAKFIFLLFFFLIGCSFRFDNIEFDSYQYALDFSEMRQYGSDIILLDRLDRGKLDLYDFCISSLLYKYTSSARFLYAIYAVVFGFFILKSYFYVKKDFSSKRDIYFYILILTIFCLNPHINLNGVRYFTATWLFFTSFLAYYMYHKKYWLVGFVLTPFIHISYLIPSFFIIISKIFVKHYNFKLIYYVSIISFIIGIVLPIDQLFEMLPTDFGIFQRYEAYTSEEAYLRRLAMAESRNVFYHIFSKFPFVYIFISLLQLKKYNLELKKEDLYLFTYVMLLLSFLFVCDKIPSISRFYCISYMLFLLFILRLYKEYKLNFIKRLIILSPLFLFGRIYEVFVNHDSVLSNIYLYRPIWDIIDYALSYKLK